jgi:hypothetical protein
MRGAYIKERLGCIAVAVDPGIFSVTAADEYAFPCLISKMRRKVYL